MHQPEAESNGRGVGKARLRCRKDGHALPRVGGMVGAFDFVATKGAPATLADGAVAFALDVQTRAVCGCRSGC